MTDKAPIPEAKPSVDAVAAPAPAAGTPPKRSPGHRGQDVRDTVAEMAARAHEISLEAGSKMAAAMKDVISAAAGITSFAIESARDLVQYMVRRGQMTQEEADKLIRDAEDAHKRKPLAKPLPPAPPTKVEAAPKPQEPPPKIEVRPKPPAPPAEPHKPAAAANKAAPAKAAAKKPAPKAAAKKASKPAAKPAAHKK